VNLRLGRLDPESRHAAQLRRALAFEAPELPAGPLPRRWAGEGYTPLGTAPLVRHKAIDADTWAHTNTRAEPRGHRLEHVLGHLHREPLPSTRRITARGLEIHVGDSTEEAPDDHLPLGHAEQLPYVLLVPLELRRTHGAGQVVLSAGEHDPIRARSDLVQQVGWIEPAPALPYDPVEHVATWGLVTLERSVDLGASRHRYTAGGGSGVALGSLLTLEGDGLVDLVRDERGHLRTPLLGAAPRRRLGAAPRWILAPLGWAGPVGGARAAAGRALRLGRGRGDGGPAEPLGRLRAQPAPGFSELYSAIHPIVGDQFVTRSALEAADLGYTLQGVLGYICDASADRSPAPGPDLPWASRFGRARRYVEGALPA
jgi:hypothetical protein